MLSPPPEPIKGCWKAGSVDVAGDGRGWDRNASADSLKGRWRASAYDFARGRAYASKAMGAPAFIRVTGDTIALSPPLIVSDVEIDKIVEILGSSLRKVN